MFTGTRLENAYRAFVPLLKNPEPEIIGKEHDGEGGNMEVTVHSWVVEDIEWDWCTMVGRITGSQKRGNRV